MMRSMTGFGRAEHKYPGGKITVEIKTVNHRFFDISSRAPSSLLFLEDKIRGHINERVMRGKVNLNIAVEGNHIAQRHFALNKKLAKEYFSLLTKLKNELKIKDNVSLEQVVSMPDVITSQSAAVDSQKAWPYIKAALDKALDKLTAARQAEGGALHKDLKKRLKAVSEITEEINLQAPEAVKNYKESLAKKIKQISESVKLDDARLEQEVTLFAKNCDVTEEITRLKAHIESFQNTIDTAEEAGRRLDFITQELLREINTIGSKAQDIKITKFVIKAKEEIEKIREQVQNVE